MEFIDKRVIKEDSKRFAAGDLVILKDGMVLTGAESKNYLDLTMIHDDKVYGYASEIELDDIREVVKKKDLTHTITAVTTF